MDGVAAQDVATKGQVDSKADDPHNLGGATHSADTLANLNSKISDATLDDASATRDPAAHGDAAHTRDYDVDFVNDLGGLPSIQADTRANQPVAETAGRLYLVTDELVIERDDGAAWSQISVASAVPAGATMTFAMNTAPTGWLKANGATISRTTYADLFAAIGTTFGVGDGSTTFKLPDLRGEFLRAWDDGRGIDSSRAFGSSQLDQMQKITGGISTRRSKIQSVSGAFTGSYNLSSNVGADDMNEPTGYFVFDSSNSPNARVSDTTSGETRARNVALLACIKY